MTVKRVFFPAVVFFASCAARGGVPAEQVPTFQLRARVVAIGGQKPDGKKSKVTRLRSSLPPSPASPTRGNGIKLSGLPPHPPIKIGVCRDKTRRRGLESSPRRRTSSGTALDLNRGRESPALNFMPLPTKGGTGRGGKSPSSPS
jgi:hypothetical protein